MTYTFTPGFENVIEKGRREERKFLLARAHAAIYESRDIHINRLILFYDLSPFLSLSISPILHSFLYGKSSY